MLMLVTESRTGRRRRARSRRRAARSRSPTAASTCCTSATCAICRARRRRPIAWSSRSTTIASVAALKGPGRPILPAADRAELVAALRGVDYVVVFGDATVERLLHAARSPTCTARAPTTPSTPCPSARSSQPTAAGRRSSAIRRPRHARSRRAHRPTRRATTRPSTSDDDRVIAF